MKPVNLIAGRPDVAWDLLYILALDPSSPIYRPELFMPDLCDNPCAVPGCQGWGPLQATCFSSAGRVDARTYTASFSTSSTDILQFLYLRASSAESLVFTNSSPSSQGKFTAVCFVQWAVLLVLL